jgi:guanylate kinase
VPARSDAQRREALELANATRQRRAALKRDIRALDADPAAVVREPPSWAATMPVTDLCQAVPRLGPERTRKLLLQCGVSAAKTLGGLTERQRDELAEVLERSLEAARADAATRPDRR